MSHTTFPKLFNPKSWADAHKRFEGTLDVGLFKRLSQLLLSDDGQIYASLHCEYNAARRVDIIGSIKGELHMQCQRCLEPCIVEVESSFTLRPIISCDSQPDIEEEDFEPVLLNEDGEAEFLAILEDELILSLPPVAKHADACLTTTQFGTLAAEAEVRKPGPFDALKQLKKQ